ncbi:amino acid adenylation domain-containing protein [Lentzea fradiae]|uniref:Amino acid adenylation domain-containing protein n=1 Tax=Lentzea fradiae TaxID=200378 RepID=A0A1G7UUP3_9PSEU|nr:amino acid adenylation domain-containing protein [Lentzea fradiae]SDG50819.1 amino acid adenylation domain-containing protein [Lentzea fradiae]
MNAGFAVRSVLVDAGSVTDCALQERFALTGEEAANACRRVMDRPIDPAGEQLTRVVLVHLAGGERRLVVTAHVDALDAESLREWALWLSAPSGTAPAHRRPVRFTGPVAGSLEWATMGGHLGTGVREECLETGLPPVPVRTLAAACAVVLARYTGVSTALVGLPDGTAISADVDDDATSAEHVATVHGLAAAVPELTPTVVVEAAKPAAVLDELVQDQPAPVVVRLDEDGRLVCRHRADLVDDSAAQGLLRSLHAVLAAFGESAVVGEIDLLRGADPLSDGGPLAGTESTIHGMVADQAAARPDAVAITCGAESTTYAELDAAATRVASWLVSAGVEPGDRVGVSLERTPHLVAALLGVLKAGAAYVPLDPGYPAKRLEYMAADAGLAAVIDRPVAADPVELPEVGPDAAAYVIYTSGSTGKPKGVVVDHRNVAALLESTKDFGFGSGDVWTFFHSYAFDFSVWEIWGCLATGGRLVVVPQQVARDPHEFHALLREQSVTVLNQTPSAFTQLLAADLDSPDRLSVRLLVFGGEQLDSRMLPAWFDRNPEDRCRVVNMYGITETTVHCTWFTIDRRAALAGSRSVGTAIPGWRLRVLDPRGRAVPPGVAGEIVVSGAGVTRGYLGKPDLTAQRFPVGPTGRRYRSGDRGRLLAGGELEHLGRLDDQVKIRGHRIELGEIKAELLADPAVVAAAVVVNRRGDGGDAHLDAYVVGPVDPAAVRDRLTGVLPAYMVPSTVTAVPRLPLTGNGKLDVGRLPAPTTEAPAPTGADTADQIAQVWHSVLGASAGPDDNLFMVGGNSLVAARIAAEIRGRRLGDVTVQQIYRTPTIRGLVSVLTAGGTA